MNALDTSAGSTGYTTGSHNQSYSTEGRSGLSKPTRYYLKHKEAFKELTQAVLSNEQLFSPETVKLAVKLNKKISKFEMMGNNELLDPKIKRLLIKCNKLQRQYMDFVVKNDGQNETIPLPMFLKEVDKLDKLMRKMGLLDESDQTIVAEMLQFIIGSIVSVDSLILKKCSEDTASAVYFASTGEEKEDRLMVFKLIEGDSSNIKTVPADERYKRQMAAYLLDRANHGRLNVPLSVLGISTDLGTTTEPVLGSLQIYKKNDGALKTLNGAQISTIGTDALHLTSIHRGRLYDLDAHLGNLLYKETDSITLIPIDFDFLLPHISSESDAENSQLKMGWRYFPQMDKPFSEETLKYLIGIDIAKETQVLTSLGFPITSIRLFHSATLAFQIGAKRELTPGKIVDYLASNEFKLLYLALHRSSLEGTIDFDATIYAQIDSSLENYSADMLNDKATYDVFVENLDKKNYEGAIARLDTLYFLRNNSRLVFKGIRKMIRRNAPQEEIRNAIDVLKSVRSTIGGDVVLAAGYGSIVASFEVMGKQDEADYWRKEFAERVGD